MFAALSRPFYAHASFFPTGRHPYNFHCVFEPIFWPFTAYLSNSQITSRREKAKEQEQLEREEMERER